MPKNAFVTLRRQLAALIATIVVLISAGKSCGYEGPNLWGDFQIGLDIFDAVDTARDNRQLKTVVWYPVTADTANYEPLRYFQHHADGFWWFDSPFRGGFTRAPVAEGRFPVVVFSHGNGGWPVQLAILGESLASHGYVVVAPRHTGNAWGTPEVVNAEVSVDRPLDISFVMDVITSRSKTEGDLLEGKLDLDSITYGGYSSGVDTILGNLTGEPLSPTALEPPIDNRPKAAILIDRSIAFDVDVPVLHVGQTVTSANTVNSVTSPSLFALGVADSHHWSFGMNDCQFRDELIESGVSAEDVNSVLGTNSWPGCAQGLRSLSESQELLATHSIAFLDHVFRGNVESEKWLEAGQFSAEQTRVNVSVTTESSSPDEGLTAVLTDPRGRRIGVQTFGAELINELSDSRVSGVGRRRQRFILGPDDVLPGTYELTGAAGLDWSGEFPYEMYASINRRKGASDTMTVKHQVATGKLSSGESFPTVEFSFYPAGDVGRDGVVDATDIDALTNAVRSGLFDSLHDVNVDNKIDENDPSFWVHDIARTYFGDANLDGEFNSLDLVDVLQSGKYGLDVDAGWAEGDWTGDGRFDRSDILIALQDGGYGRGGRAAVSAIPEPSCALLLLIGLIGVLRRRQPR